MSSPLRIIRDKLSITQTELAELMGTTQATVSRMEAGQWEPNASQVQAVLRKSNEDGLDLSFDDFIFSNNQELSTDQNGNTKEKNYFNHKHLLGIQELSPEEITFLLDLADVYAEKNRTVDRKLSLLNGKTVINLFFEESTRTRTSFELASKHLGADVINIAVASSSIKKGETVIDTAVTLNAMHADALVVRHPHAGAVQLLSEKVN